MELWGCEAPERGEAQLTVATDPRATARSPAHKVPIQAVVRAFSVLEALAARPTGVRLADLSRTVGLHKATVYRLVRTMILLGYVTQTADGAPYRIMGPSKEGDSLRRAARRLFIPGKRGRAGKS